MVNNLPRLVRKELRLEILWFPSQKKDQGGDFRMKRLELRKQQATGECKDEDTRKGQGVSDGGRF